MSRTIVVACAGMWSACLAPASEDGPVELEAARLDEGLVGQTIERDAERHFQARSLPAGSYTFAITGTGDADLYVRVGRRPTTRTFDCRPFRDDSDESCTIRLTATGSIHVMVRGFAPSSTFDLHAHREEIGLTTRDEILAASRAVPRTETFDSNLFGDDEFRVSPTLRENMIDTSEMTTEAGWRLHRPYVRVIFSRLLSAEDELRGEWEEFLVGEDMPVGAARSWWVEPGTGRLFERRGAATSPWVTADGDFLTAEDAPEPAQAVLFFDEADLGDFFETCLPLTKAGVEYSVCRELTDASRARQRVRYQIWARVRDDVDLDAADVSARVVDDIENGRVPSDLLPAL